MYHQQLVAANVHFDDLPNRNCIYRVLIKTVKSILCKALTSKIKFKNNL